MIIVAGSRLRNGAEHGARRRQQKISAGTAERRWICRLLVGFIRRVGRNELIRFI
ncbi:MAG: hypothetical protein R3C05_23805 [Pirellulaceae bacterium]